MKINRYLFISVCLFIFLNCQKTTSSHHPNEIILQEKDCFPERKTQQNIRDIKGSVILIGETFLIEVQNENIRYAPCNLPESLKIEKLNVLFSAEIKEIYPNERWMGEPCVISKVKILKPE